MFKSLTTRNENPLNTWQREMNNVFDRFSKELDLSGSLEDFSPKVEVNETEKGYMVKAEVPGMSEKDINIYLRDNNLVLEGERRSESKKEKKGHFMSEIRYGSFYRSVPFQEDVNPDNVKASYKDGMLTIELEKVETNSSKTKKISITKQ